MTYLSTLILYLLSFSPQGGGWKAAETDDSGDLIILKIDMRPNCKHNPKDEVVTADSDWSIVMRYGISQEETYCIFDNQRNRIFSTSNYTVFLSELRKLPDGINIRDIGKCTVPFRVDFPLERMGQLNTVLEKKNCTLEERIMYCYCCAEEIHYPF